MKKVLTLCMVVKDNMILLGKKKRGFAVGGWNGFGGKVESGETISGAAFRELHEETGITALDMHKVGLLTFSFDNTPKVLEVHVFKVTEYTGTPTESEEMFPSWFRFDEIPYESMWPDDAHWIPYLFQNKIFKGSFHFDELSDTNFTPHILTYSLNEILDRTQIDEK